MNEMNKILVTGATGFIGYEVARQLSEQQLKPRLLVRRMHRGMLVSQMDAEPMVGDLTSPESLRRALDGVDTVIHLGARATFESYSLLKPSIVNGTLNLFHAAAEAGVSHFVHASSMLVYGDVAESGHPIDEGTPLTPNTGYGRAKQEAEEALLPLAQSKGITLSILRLPHVYGAQDAFFAKIRDGLMLMPGAGNKLYSHMHIQDAARVLIAAAQQRREMAIPVADDLAADWNTFFGVVKTYYPRMRTVRVPADLALWGASALQWWFRFQGKQTLETPDGVRGWNLALPVKKGIVWDALGLDPLFPTIYEGIPSVLDDCVSYRWIHPVNDHQ